MDLEKLKQLMGDITRNQAVFYDLTGQLETMLGYEVSDRHLQNILDENYAGRKDGLTHAEVNEICLELQAASRYLPKSITETDG